LVSNGEIIPPCGLPFSVGSNFPLPAIPGFRELSMGLNTFPSLTFSFTDDNINSFAPIFFVDVSTFYCLWRVGATFYLVMDLAQVSS